MNPQINPESPYIDIAGICRLFTPPISRVTFWKWRRCRTFNPPQYRIGGVKGKIFYKLSEVLQEIEKNRQSQN